MSGHPNLWQFKALTSEGWVVVICANRYEARLARKRFRKHGQETTKEERRT